jgi:phage gp46-like protein
MPDIALTWDEADMVGVWSVADGDLVTGGDLFTAYGISLFTDRVAGPDDVIADGTDDPRGWWGDADLGSHFWLRERSMATPVLLSQVEEDAGVACRWLIDSGAVAAHSFTASYVAPGFLLLVVQSTDRDGRTVSLQYRWAWQGLAAA